MGARSMDVQLMVGDRDALSFEDMRPDELVIVKALTAARAEGRDVLRIAEIMAAAGWDEVDDHECTDGHCTACSDALRMGNSKVRNNLRRLMRYGWIRRPLDGSYSLNVVTQTTGLVETAPQVEAVPKLRIETVSQFVAVERVTRRNPKEISLDEQERMHRRTINGNMGLVNQLKKADCTFYNACLSQADSGNWAGFSCSKCTAYARADQFQAEQDVLALRAAQTAHDQIMKYGKINRIRGVKPGADAKRTESVEDDIDIAV